MAVKRKKALTANVAVIGVGLDIYWGQFDGLLDELKGKLAEFVKKVESNGVVAKNFGIVDNAQAAYKVLPAIKAMDPDLLFVDMVTYATSSTFGVIIKELNIPVALVALQPLAAMDYPNARTYVQLCNDDFCAVPEFTGVAVRMGKKAPNVIIGMLHNDPQADVEIAEYCDIAKVCRSLKTARFGHMGHVLEAMLDMHTDPTSVTAAFGSHVVQCEPDHIMKHYKSVTAEEIAVKRKEILEFFDTPNPVSDPLTTKVTDKDLDIAAKAAVALEKFIEEQKLDGFAYYYEAKTGSPMRELVTNLIVGNSLLTSAGLPMCGEYDLKTCIAMMIMDRLGMGGSFAEFHPIDFQKGSVLVGHDGPHHLNIAEGRPVLRSLLKYHGKPGTGAGVEFRIKDGPITMLSIGLKADGKFKFIVAEGASLNGPIPPTGNTNTHGYFKPDVRTFLKRWVAEGPTHHFALGIGHKAAAIKKVAEIFGIECAIIPPD
ncbi:MAG: L-fucose/L-arabinose isomerase family protein [Verrucomicrobia bacterium]|nr:L-fucose/L-arabinose isomerase family protein [Verrucomicrobiota bacterium]MBU1735518.1 L-fucose/L-arabinose isomerase family protein [Verrucomicrobiota bacterium]MBU1855442.1 L-fucose/L-arabinose isomerase family protein [Verrucomicrobiota bacterium]